MFLVDDVPYLIDKAGRSTLYRFPRLDPAATVTLEKVGVLAGPVANLSGADLSGDRRRLRALRWARGRLQRGVAGPGP